MDNPSCWPKVLPRIQSLLNNTSSLTTGKTLNEVAYVFSPRRPLDLCLALTLPNTYVACAKASDVISFALANQKEHYDGRQQPLFMRVGDWAMLRLHKGYSISSSIGVTKKLTHQYVGPFRIVEKIGRLAYKLDVPSDWRIHLVFFVAQLEPAPYPAEDPFQCFRPQHPTSVFVEGDTDRYKSFEIDRLLNKRTIRKGRGLAIEYLVRWTGYSSEWNRWYNIKDLNNAVELVETYKKDLTQRGHWGFSWRGEVVTVLPLFFPFSPILSLLLNLMLLYYKTRIGLARVTWPHLIFLSSHINHGKHRCRLSYWPTEAALLVSRIYTGRTLFSGIQG